jgi:hypothetical protein
LTLIPSQTWFKGKNIGTPSGSKVLSGCSWEAAHQLLDTLPLMHLESDFASYTASCLQETARNCKKLQETETPQGYLGSEWW